MPSAPPSSRVVSFTAEPTPAFDNGTDDMISLVAGAAVMPMPAPRMAKATAMTTYGVSVDSVARSPKPSATIPRPAAMSRGAPYRLASAALRGDTATNVRASGKLASPASSGE